MYGYFSLWQAYLSHTEFHGAFPYEVWIRFARIHIAWNSLLIISAIGVLQRVRLGRVGLLTALTIWLGFDVWDYYLFAIESGYPASVWLPALKWPAIEALVLVFIYWYLLGPRTRHFFRPINKEATAFPDA